MIEMTDLMHRDDPRNPYYNPRKHGFFTECGVCGEYIHKNDLYTWLDGDKCVHDECNAITTASCTAINTATEVALALAMDRLEDS